MPVLETKRLKLIGVNRLSNENIYIPEEILEGLAEVATNSTWPGFSLTWLPAFCNKLRCIANVLSLKIVLRRNCSCDNSFWVFEKLWLKQKRRERFCPSWGNCDLQEDKHFWFRSRFPEHPKGFLASYPAQELFFEIFLTSKTRLLSLRKSEKIWSFPATQFFDLPMQCVFELKRSSWNNFWILHHEQLIQKVIQVVGQDLQTFHFNNGSKKPHWGFEDRSCAIFPTKASETTIFAFREPNLTPYALSCYMQELTSLKSQTNEV